MKVVFDCQMPSLLAHGGAQIQATNTIMALREIGVDADYVRWWDAEQKADVLHFLGRVNGFYSNFARTKGIKFVLADLLSSQGSRTTLQRIPHWCLRQFDRLTHGKIIASNFGWTTYRRADAVIAGTSWEAELMPIMFGADPKKIHIVPNGVEEVFFRKAEMLDERNSEREGYLVSTATITERKRVLELAEAAVLAKTPVWIVGKPYSEAESYYREFLALQRANPKIIRYEGAISDRGRLAKIYQSARGFVLLSSMETRSLSSEEAAAAGCPLLLSKLPWAKSVFGENATYCDITGKDQTATTLRNFYDAAPGMPRPPLPLTWRQVAEQFKAIYNEILSS